MKWRFNERTFLCLARRQEDGAEENKNSDFSILKQTNKKELSRTSAGQLPSQVHWTFHSRLRQFDDA